MAENTKLKWGVIANGGIANAFAHSIKHSKTSKLLAVFGRNETKVKSFAEKHQIKAFVDLDKFLNSDLDAVYIATPHDTHFLYSMACIRKNIHVLCEKPLTLNSSESMILINAAIKKRVFLMEAFMYRCHPQTFKILELVEKYFIGKRVKIKSSFGFTTDVSKEHRLRNPNLAGGAILDVGCYPLSMVRLISGKLNRMDFSDPIGISIEGELDETGVDAKSTAILDFTDEISAEIKTAIHEEYENNLIIESDDLCLEVSDPWHCGQFSEGESVIKFTNEGTEEKIEINDQVGLFTREIDEAANCIEQGRIESPKMTHRDSLGNMLWLEKWYTQLGVNFPNNEIKNSQIKTHDFGFNPNFNENLSNILDKSTPRIVFGCDNQFSDLHAFCMFEHFYQQGGRIFDTAYIYNNGLSDGFLGRWINEQNLKDEIVILGKGAHTPHCEPGYIRPQLEESLERMNLDHLDIFCLHRDNPEIPVDEFIDELNEIKASGLISLIGASNWTFDRFKKANEYARNFEKEGFKVLSNNFSLAEMNEPVWPGCVNCDDEYLDYLIANEIFLFPWSSQARGFFVEQDLFPKLTHGANPTREEEIRVWHSESNLSRRERCFELAQQLNCTPIELALAYVINRSDNIFPLIGPRNLFESESCMKALTINLTESQISYLLNG